MTQPGIELGHPRTLYPDDVIRNTIRHLGHPIYVVNEGLFIYHSLLTLHIYAIYKIYNMHIRYIQYILHIRYIILIYYVCFFLFFRTQPGIEPGNPRTLYPDDVIRNTIGHVRSPINVVNKVLFIYLSLLTLHIYAIYKIYNMHIRYMQYILHIRYIIHIYYACFFSFFRTQPGIEPGHPLTLYPDDVIRNTIGHVGSTIYVVNDVLFIYHSLLTLHIYAIYVYIICI